jgi:hypothetical protein
MTLKSTKTASIVNADEDMIPSIRSIDVEHNRAAEILVQSVNEFPGK